MHPDCRRAQVDKLFSRVWFYFDTVVVWDECTHYLGYHWDEMRTNSNWIENWLLPYIGTLLYIKRLGADELLDFRMKRPRSFNYWLKTLLLEQKRLKGLRDSLGRTLLSEASIQVYRTDEMQLQCAVNHPILDHTSFFPVPKRIQGTPEAVRRFAAKQIASDIVGYLMSDIDSARFYNVPLGVTHSSEKYLLAGHDEPKTASDVAFNLELPFLSDVPIETLLEVRRDQGEYFHKFRNALSIAVKERMRTRELANSTEIAKDIQEDIIERELRQIKTQLTAAKSSLMKKAAVNVVLGALLTTCGYVAGMGPASLLGFTAPGILSASPFADFIDKNADIRLNDMFFLWQAVEHAHSRVE
jgi:hypothetical protein